VTKPAKKKLTLNKATIRKLENAELASVTGGFEPSPTPGGGGGSQHC
jgi:hypothetical protein